MVKVKKIVKEYKWYLCLIFILLVIINIEMWYAYNYKKVHINNTPNDCIDSYFKSNLEADKVPDNINGSILASKSVAYLIPRMTYKINSVTCNDSSGVVNITFTSPDINSVVNSFKDNIYTDNYYSEDILLNMWTSSLNTTSLKENAIDIQVKVIDSYWQIEDTESLRSLITGDISSVDSSLDNLVKVE